MPVIQVEAHVSHRELLQAVTQLGPQEFSQFVTEVLQLRAQRQTPRLPAAETELLLRINQGLPPELRQRYQELQAERRQETLTPAEHAELLHLTDDVEQHEANRLAALEELARMRGTTLGQLMTALQIPAPAHE